MNRTPRKAQLRRDLQTSRDHADSLADSVAAARSERDRLRDQLRDQIACADERTRALEAELMIAEKDASALRDQREQARNELAEARASLKDLGEDYAELGRIRDGLHLDVKAANRHIDRLQAELTEASAEGAGMAGELGRLRDQVEAARRSAKIAQPGLDAGKREITGLRGKIAILEAERERLHDRLDALGERLPEVPVSAPVPPATAPAPLPKRTRASGSRTSKPQGDEQPRVGIRGGPETSRPSEGRTAPQGGVGE